VKSSYEEFIQIGVRACGCAVRAQPSAHGYSRCNAAAIATIASARSMKSVGRCAPHNLEGGFVSLASAVPNRRLKSTTWPFLYHGVSGRVCSVRGYFVFYIRWPFDKFGDRYSWIYANVTSKYFYRRHVVNTCYLVVWKDRRIFCRKRFRKNGRKALRNNFWLLPSCRTLVRNNHGYRTDGSIFSNKVRVVSTVNCIPTCILLIRWCL